MVWRIRISPMRSTALFRAILTSVSEAFKCLPGFGDTGQIQLSYSVIQSPMWSLNPSSQAKKVINSPIRHQIMQANPKSHKPVAWEKVNATVLSCKARFFVIIILSMVVLPMVASAVGPAVQLLWSTQPGSANCGAPFGQQPVLITADAQGNPSTLNLPSSVPVTIDTVPSGGLHGGARSLDIGTSAANGTITFTDLQIDSAGGYSLTALAGNGTNAVFSPTNGIAGCQMWLDASDLATQLLNTNNQVRIWMDKSGTLNDATNVNANGVNNTPYTNINANLSPLGYGAQRTVSFYGTNRLNIDLTRITNSTFSIVSVTMLNPTVTPNNDYFIGTPFNNVDNTLHIGYRNTAQYTFAMYADDLNVATPGAIPLITSHIHSPGAKQLYFNGAFAGNGGSANLGVVLQGNIGRGNGGNYHGDISEMIVYNTNLTEVQRVGLENYLANKWFGQFSAGQASASFFVNCGFVPQGIRFSQQPTDTTAGVNISPAVAVTVTNSAGSGVPGLTVFISLRNGAGTLNGTLSQVTDGSGVATFSDLNLTVAGQKQLRAVIPGVLTNDSSAFNIVAAAPSQLARITNPSGSATAGVAFAVQPVIAVQDQYGNVVSNATDTITVSQTAGGTISQTAGNSIGVAAVAGTATFSGLYITNTGTSTLTFTDSTLSLSTNSPNITVVASAPATLAIQQQPSSTAQVGVPLDTQPIVSAADAYGNPVANGTVISVSASSGNVSGQANIATTGGTATYSGLSLTNLGTITLTFTAGSTSTNSTAITVTAGPAVTVIWTTQPGSALAGSPLSQQPVLKTADAGGNITTLGLGPTNLVVVHLISGSGLVGEPLTYNIGTDGSNGVITFHNLQVNNPGASNVLAADFLGSVDPTNNIPNCVLWLDAYDANTITLDGSTNVVAWADKSGTGNNATNTANYPSTNLNTAIPVNAYGGQHAVSFFGNNWLNISLDSLTGSLSGYTIFVVDVVGNITGNNYFLGSDFNNVDATLHFGYRNANTFTSSQYADDLNWTAPANFSPATPRLWMTRIDASASRQIFLNGVQRANNGVSLVGPLTNSTVGRGNGGLYAGDLSEVIIYNRGLDDTERATVEQYLNHKWFSNSRGLSVPFTVSGLAPTLSIARNGTNVALTVSGVPGQTYRVLASPTLALPMASWSPIGTNTLPGSGLWQLNDVINPPTQFYRAVTP
jgi:hypothetical protein